jgi:hypothetical protein
VRNAVDAANGESKNMSPKTTFFGSLLFLGVVSCSDDTTSKTDAGSHYSSYPTCDAIIKACHPLDVGDGPIHDCHDLGHGATSDAECAPKKDECLRTCVATPDGGSADGGGDAGP